MNFFEAAAYRGAVSADNNWTEGWIRTSGNGDETSANAEEILQGELTTNKTLEANKVYALSGDYIVKTGATLTIQEGVKIVAMTDDESVDYILVQQGAKNRGCRNKRESDYHDLRQERIWCMGRFAHLR